MNTKNKWPEGWIKWNNNDIKSIERAERKKLSFENKGYRAVHSFINSITGECTLTYYTKPAQ